MKWSSVIRAPERRIGKNGSEDLTNAGIANQNLDEIEREREIYILYIMYMYVYIYGPHILYYINKLHDHLNKHTNELQGGSIAASKKKATS